MSVPRVADADALVPPALMAAEWERRTYQRSPDSRYRLEYWGADGVLSIGNRTPESESVHESPSELAALVALANAALPDADPRKFTRHDLTWVESLRSASVSRPERDWLEGFAAKLRALLPPA